MLPVPNTQEGATLLESMIVDVLKENHQFNIILHLLQLIQYLYQQNCWLINFICRYIPLKQWAFDDSHSPKYQKFLRILSVLCVVLLTISSTITMAETDNTSVKSVVRLSPPAKLLQLLYVLPALIAAIP